MNKKSVIFRNALLLGVSFSLAACGGGAGGPGLVTTPAPVTVPTTPPTATPAATTPTVPANETKVFTEGLTSGSRINGVDYYQKGDYITYVQNWGAEMLKIPKSDYSQKVEVQTASFPNKTLITWKYPDTPYGSGNIVYGFPEIAWGKTTLAMSGYNTDNAIGKVGDISEFNMSYDITLTGDPKYNNLMHDLWLWDDKTGNIASEICFSVKPSQHNLYWSSPSGPFGQKQDAHSYQFVQGGVTYNMLVSPMGGDLVNVIPGAKNIAIIPIDGSQNTVGTVDWMQVLKILLDAKDIDPNWLVKGLETGVEVQAGSGSMLVNAYSVTLKLKDQKVQAMVVTVANSTAQTTTAASQINAATMQQILNAALSNPKTTTYAFGQGNIGMGTNFALNEKLSIGTSNVFYTGNIRGYTMASNLTWRNKNNYAILMGGAGRLRINNNNTDNTFAAMEVGSRIPTKLATFAPYTRFGYTRYYSAPNSAANKPMVDPIALNSMKLSGGVNTEILLSQALLLRVSGEVSNEFLGRSQAKARYNNYASVAPINVSGVEYAGSINLSTKLGKNVYTQMEVGSKKNRIGANNYANIGLKVPF